MFCGGCPSCAVVVTAATLSCGQFGNDFGRVFHSTGLHRLQALFQEVAFSSGNETLRMEVVRQVSSAEEVLSILQRIDAANR